MTIQTTIISMATDIISSFMKNAFWLITGYILFKLFAKTIKESVKEIIKEVPIWIEQWEKTKMRTYRVEKAIGGR